MLQYFTFSVKITQPLKTEIYVYKIILHLRKVQNLRLLQRLASLNFLHELSHAIFRILLNIYCTVTKCKDLSVTASDIYYKFISLPLSG